MSAGALGCSGMCVLVGVLHTHTHVHMHVHTQMHTHTHTCVHTHAHTHTRACTHTYTHKQTCIHIHRYTHTQTHTHTHTHTHRCTHFDLHYLSGTAGVQQHVLVEIQNCMCALNTMLHIIAANIHLSTIKSIYTCIWDKGRETTELDVSLDYVCLCAFCAFLFY